MNGNGNSVLGKLPYRTLTYLQNGAQKGNRNEELLHAACQFRDAGYSEEQALAELRPRAIADGLSSAEATRTVASAFSRPPREPIGPAKEEPEKRPLVTYRFEWSSLVNDVSPASLSELAKWRGYSAEFCEWLKEHGMIGLYRGCWALPVFYDGRAVAAHVRSKDKNDWFFEPKLRDFGIKNQALMIGSPKGSKTVYIAESQWDLFAVLDRTGAYRDDDIAGVATRGAGNSGLLSGVMFDRCEIVAFPQNDGPGEKWLRDSEKVLGGKVRVVRVPKEFKDVNEWTRDGHVTSEELSGAIRPIVASSLEESPEGWCKDGVEPNSEEHLAYQLWKQLGQVKCVGSDWYLYDACSGVWRPCDRDEFQPRALDMLPREKRTQRRAKDVIVHLEMRSQVPRSQFCGAIKHCGTGAVLIAVENGLLEITGTGSRLVPPRGKEGFTISLPVSYQPFAASPTFDRVLYEAVPDAAERELFLDVLASALIPDCRYEAALVQIGEASTGKSTVSGVLPKIFGQACSSLSMSDLCHPTGYKLAMLDRKMINISSELNTLEFEDSGLFKQLISGERFTARPIYGRPFEMCSTATFVFLANSLPRFKHGTDAEVRRLRFVRFNHKPTTIDTTLKPKVEADAPGVFAKLVKRAEEFLAGRPLAPQGEWGKQTAERFSVSNDPIGQFVRDRCILGSNKQCKKEQLLNEFEDFKQENEISQKFTENHFFRALYDRFPGVKDSKIRVGADRLRVIRGIDIKDD